MILLYTIASRLSIIFPKNLCFSVKISISHKSEAFVFAVFTIMEPIFILRSVYFIPAFISGKNRQASRQNFAAGAGAKKQISV